MSYAWNIDPKVVDHLLDIPKIDVNHKDKSGTTALIEACWNKAQPQVIMMLIEQGANINHVTNKGDNLLGTYLYWCDPHDSVYVRQILKFGFDVNLLSKSDRETIEQEI